MRAPVARHVAPSHSNHDNYDNHNNEGVFFSVSEVPLQRVLRLTGPWSEWR